MQKWTTTVEAVDGFNFTPNPLQEGTHIFESFLGIFVCQSPDGEFDRFKYQPARKASKKEQAIYMAWFEIQLRLCDQWEG